MCERRGTAMRAALLLVGAGLMAGVALAVPGQAAATQEDLGTLFYSAAERAAMVEARRGEADAPLRSTRMTVNGVVRRERANSTAWVNGQPVADGHTLPLAGRVQVQRGGVTLDGKPLRVGESLDVVTQTRGDVVAPGAVTRKGAP
jgi:hypothetical protein